MSEVNNTQNNSIAVDENIIDGIPGSEVPELSKEEQMRELIRKPIMTRRKMERIKAELEALQKEAESKMLPKKTHFRLKMISLFSMLSLGGGISMVMNGRSHDMYPLGLQISIASLTAIILISIFLKIDSE